MSTYRVIVVGGGGSGVPFAVRLAEAGDVEVRLVEAGPAWTSPAQSTPEYTDSLWDASTVAQAMPGAPLAWTYEASLFPGRDYRIARGRLLGGSTAVNGAYFMRAHPDDYSDWAAIGGPEWSYDSALPALRRLERDLDFPDDPRHGADGPVPVVRASKEGAITQGFLEASVEQGHPLIEDKNLDRARGVGLLPLNAVDGRRWSTAAAYLDGAIPQNLTIIGDTRVHRILFRGTRAIGVEMDDGTTLRREFADEIVISAGAVETPRLLMRSGLGAGRGALDARSHVADLPGVGRNLSDHPAVMIDWMPRVTALAPSRASWTAALNLSAPDGSDRGDLEILLGVMPHAYVVSGDIAPGPIGLRIALQTPLSRGVVHADREPVAISYDYLSSPRDRATLRHGVREGLQMLRSRALAPVVDAILAPVDELLGDDAAADDWIRGRLGTSLHASGTARMGSEMDADAVADAHGRVFGTERLRVVDTSLLPTVPSRGTAATAVFLGERLAELWRSEPQRAV